MWRQRRGPLDHPSGQTQTGEAQGRGWRRRVAETTNKRDALTLALGRLQAGVRVAVVASAAERVTDVDVPAQAVGQALLVATQRGDLAEAVRWAETTGTRTPQARLALGQLLGMPTCCLHAHPDRDLLAPPPLQWPPWQWFLPCQPRCEQAERAMSPVRALLPAEVRALHGPALLAGVPPLPDAWTLVQARVDKSGLRIEATGPLGVAAVTLHPVDTQTRSYRQHNGLGLTCVGRSLTPAQEALVAAWWPSLENAATDVLVALAPPPAEAPIKRLRPTRATAFAPRRQVLGPRDVEHMFRVDYAWGDDDDPRHISRIGVIYRCNQWCAFCALAEMDVELSRDKVQDAIRAAWQSGSRRLILTGGEPTLRTDLPALVAFAREVGFAHITLQTNAVRLSAGPMVDALVAAGLTHAQVSLHGPDADFSDLLTQAPGTHDRSVAGVTRLLEAGVHVLLNCVLFAQTLDRLDAYLAMCTTLWQPFQDHLTLQFRMPSQEFDDVAVARQYMPTYTALAPRVRAVIADAQARGFDVGEASQPVTAPSWCILKAAGVDISGWLENPPPTAHHAWESSWFTRVPACAACPAAAHCPGARKDYVDLWGDAEFFAL